MAVRAVLEPHILDGMGEWIASGRPPPLDDFGMDARLRFGPDGMVDRIFDIAARRSRHIAAFGFAIPCAEAIDALLALGPMVEVGAGTGYWSAMLARRGADVIATDLVRPMRRTGYGQRVSAFHPVVSMSAAMAIKRHPERAVFASWPCLHPAWMEDALSVVRPGIRVAIVHEGDGGCVGTDGMFERLGRWFVEEAEVWLPNFPSIRDRLTIWRKRGHA